jgi:hypothetical protein
MSFFGGTFVIHHSDVKGGQGSVENHGNPYTWGAGMIDQDPQFTDTGSSDFTLLSSSPCIDTADPTYRPTGRDVGGVPRLLDGDLDGFRFMDMGANEFSNVHLSITGSLTPGGNITITSTGTPGLQSLLWLGVAPGEVVVGWFGPVFMDLSLPWVLVPWVTVPSTVNATIPADVPAPISIIVQQLAHEATGQGNMSNDVVLDIN